MKQISAPQALDHGRAGRARPEKLLVSPDEAAEILSIGRTYLYELIRAGEIKSVQVGRLRRVPVDALHEYVERLKAQTPDRLEAARPGQL